MTSLSLYGVFLTFINIYFINPEIVSNSAKYIVKVI